MTSQAVRRARATDTRTIAYTWMLDHLPHNAIVAREQYTPQVRPDQFRLRNHNRLYLRNMEWYRQLRVRYVVTSSDLYARFVDNPATPVLSAFYQDLFKLPEVFRWTRGDGGTARPSASSRCRSPTAPERTGRSTPPPTPSRLDYPALRGDPNGGSGTGGARA
jgi:hypothetical protein